MKKYPILLLLITSLMFSCKKTKTKEEEAATTNPAATGDINNTLGYGMLTKIKGIWNGPITSTTPLGNYPEFIVDFRPISENQISAKNELDTLNDIHMSFFIALYKNEYKICFRNGGSFNGASRVSYFLADSVVEGTTQSYYGFTEIKKGRSRAYTEIIFRNDSLYMKTFTNKSNTLSFAAPHMTWSAKLMDSTSCQIAVTNFAFPKKTLTKDFTLTFNGLTESLYYTLAGEPYPESANPYLGQSTLSYTYLSSLGTPDPAKKTFIIVTTQPMFNMSGFITANLKYRSRYILLSANDLSHVFNYMHPGTYYLYALYDADGNLAASSNDWISTNNTTFTLTDKGTLSASTQINYSIP